MFDPNNKVLNNGVELWVTYWCRFHLSDVTFKSNTTNNSGGGLYANYAYTSANNLLFELNSAANSAAIEIWSARLFDFHNVELKNNTATQSGVATFNLFDVESDAYLTNWSVVGNTADQWMFRFDDGARANNKKIYIDNLLLANNQTSGYEGPGLGFNSSAGEFILRNATIVNNYSSAANSGGTSLAQVYNNYAHQALSVKVLNSIIDSENGYSIASNDWNSNVTITAESSMIIGGSSSVDEGQSATITLSNSVSGYP